MPERLPGFDADAHALPLLDAVHEALGGRAAESWKLPDYLARICREHHRPPPEASRELHIVRLSAAAVEIEMNPRHAPERPEELQDSARVLGIDPHKLRTLSAEIRGFVKKAEGLLGG